MRKGNRLAGAAVALSVGLIATACQVDEEPVATAGDGSGGASGTIVVSGSSTVEPISAEVANRFNKRHPSVDITIDGPGTGDGFELFCNGLTDVNDASSKVKPEQLEACEANGIEMIELQIANDGITMLTNANNDAVECLTLADLYALVGPESQGINTWSDAQALATELGSSTDLPDAPLDIVGPGEESGTFASFVELVIEELNEDRGAEATTRPDYQASADDNVIIQGIQGAKTSLGWVGFAFAEGAEGVRELAVDAGDGCVSPTADTIADGSYPISRPLFIYVNKAKAEANPALAEWVDFYLSDDGIGAVSEAGYVDLSAEDLASTRQLWESRMVGAQA